MAMGKTDIYIIIIYETWIAGCRSERFTDANPAVRVLAAVNKPFKTRKPGGLRLVTVESLSYIPCQQTTTRY